MTDTTPFPRELRWFCAVVFAAAVLAVVGLIVADGFPPIAPVAVFGGLLIFTRHRDVTLPNGAFVSAGVMVVMGAAVVFVAEDALVGAAIVGLLHGVYLPSLNKRSWGWVPFNAGITSIALFLATAVLQMTTTDAAMPFKVINVIPPAIVFAAVSWALIALSYRVEQGTVPSEVLREFVPSFLQAIPFAVLGYFVGELYLELGAAVMLLIIVPILIAREMFASYLRVKESHDETVHMLIRALEAKDRYTAGHAERVARYAQYMGEQMNFGPVRMERLRFAALMHDIGKLVVPNHLLNKPGQLTAEEFGRIRVHEKVSVQMLSHIDFLRPIAGASHSDITTFDPDDPDHPIEPYMVMIADAYDAMTSTRSYRRALSQEVAFEELRDKAGIQFHPACVEALIEAVETRGEKHGAGYEEQTEFLDAPVLGVGSAGLGDLLPTEA
jgi:HD superfamily phosphodiesterase